MVTTADIADLRRDLMVAHSLLALGTRTQWGMPQLLEHWPAWKEPRIKRELAARVGLRFARGHSVEVNRSDVIAIDRQLEDEATARRAGGGEGGYLGLPGDAAKVGRALVAGEARRAVLAGGRRRRGVRHG